MVVWYPNPKDEEALRALSARLPTGIRLARVRDDSCEVLIEGRPTAEMLDACPNLRAVIVPFAGVPQATLELVRRRNGITIHNLHHNAPETAELAVALLLAAAKRVVPMDAALRKGDWRPRYQPDGTVSLEGKTALVLGYGEIGKRAARSLHCLGMSVIGVRKSPTGPNRDEVAEIRSASELRKLLPQADVLVLCLPQTPETDRLLGREELSLLPRGAILVNVARATIVEEAALFEALSNGTLHSAGLDVWYRYPAPDERAIGIVPGYFEAPESAANTMPSSFPFHELENVVLSPHRAGAALGTETRRAEHLAKLLEAAAAGRPIPNRVDLEAGY